MNPSGPEGAGEVILALEGVSRIYGEEIEVRALDDVSMEIRAGEFVSIVGPSGSGKSTMLGLLGILDLPTHGVIRVRGVDAAGLSDADRSRLRGDAIGFVFQQFFLTPNATVLENVVLPLKIAGVGRAERKRRGLAALAELDMQDKAKNKATALSGGQKQMLAIARAIIEPRELLLVDEPTASLDPRTGRQIMRLLCELVQERGMPALVNIHDVALAQSFADRIIGLRDGRIIFDGISFPQVLPQYDNSVVVTSHAKDLALPGERIGYIAVNPNYAGKEELSGGLSFCNRTLGFVNAPALMQHIVRNLQGVSVDAGYYEKKRDYLCQNLGELGYEVVQPQGAFYLYPKAPIEDDVVFCRALLSSNVLVVPGRGFGTPGYFRISYCVEDWVLEGAVQGFAKAVAAPEG